MFHAVSRASQERCNWEWDVFICHASADNAIGLLAYWRLLQTGLRTFLDERTYAGPFMGDHEMAAVQGAAVSSQIALVLLSEEFFREIRPQRELHRFLDQHAMQRGRVVPVFLSVSVQRCESQKPAPLVWSSVLVCFLGFPAVRTWNGLATTPAAS